MRQTMTEQGSDDKEGTKTVQGDDDEAGDDDKIRGTMTTARGDDRAERRRRWQRGKKLNGAGFGNRILRVFQPGLSCYHACTTRTGIRDETLFLTRLSQLVYLTADTEETKNVAWPSFCPASTIVTQYNTSATRPQATTGLILSVRESGQVAACSVWRVRTAEDGTDGEGL